MGANAQTFVPTFVSGQQLTAAQQNAINNGIPVFADASARTAAFGGANEKTLAQGQFSYLESDGKLYIYDGSVWKEFSAGADVIQVQVFS